MPLPTSQSYGAGPDDAGKTCSICQTQAILGERVTKCSACGLVYHVECWCENVGCAQYGCRNAPDLEKKTGPVLQSNIWGEEKTCPQCQKSIKATALKCRYCGTTFDTRDYVSKTEFAEREYRGKEYAFARAVLVGMFLASITGCLSPCVLPLQIALRYYGSLGSKLEFRRLPDELKALNLIGLIASAALVGAGLLALLLQAATNI